MLRPHTRDEVVAIVKVAAEHNVSLVTRGAASNCSAGVMAASDRAVIDLTKMNHVLDIDPAARTARVQPGVINSDLQEQLSPAQAGVLTGPRIGAPSDSRRQYHRKRRWPTRLQIRRRLPNHVLSVEAVLADGTVMNLSAGDDGPDLLGLLIGSEGTLAILTEATVALRPIAPITRSLMGSFAAAQDAAETISAIIRTGTVPAAIEWLDRARHQRPRAVHSRPVIPPMSMRSS